MSARFPTATDAVGLARSAFADDEDGGQWTELAPASKAAAARRCRLGSDLDER